MFKAERGTPSSGSGKKDIKAWISSRASQFSHREFPADRGGKLNKCVLSGLGSLPYSVCAQTEMSLKSHIVSLKYRATVHSDVYALFVLIQ